MRTRMTRRTNGAATASLARVSTKDEIDVRRARERASCGKHGISIECAQYRQRERRWGLPILQTGTPRTDLRTHRTAAPGPGGRHDHQFSRDHRWQAIRSAVVRHQFSRAVFTRHVRQATRAHLGVAKRRIVKQLHAHSHQRLHQLVVHWCWDVPPGVLFPPHQARRPSRVFGTCHAGPGFALSLHHCCSVEEGSTFNTLRPSHEPCKVRREQQAPAWCGPARVMAASRGEAGTQKVRRGGGSPMGWLGR